MEGTALDVSLREIGAVIRYMKPYKAYGFANQPTSVHREDGIALRNCYVAAVVRCALPANKPTKDEFETCRPFVQDRTAVVTEYTSSCGAREDCV